MKTLLVMLAALFFADATSADPGSVAGTWLSGDGDGLIAVSLNGNDISARILGSPNKDPNRPKTDVKNPDPALRDRLLVGLEIFSRFNYDGNGHWSGGFIYDPNSGKTYRCKLKLVNHDTLKVRGYIGIALIGRTETWIRQAS